MSSYLILPRTGLFFFKFFKERSVQKSVSQNYFKANQIVSSDNWKVSPWTILRESKINI